MADDRGGPIDEGHPNPDILVVLLPLFLVSGCAALIYEVVWLQLLQLVVGSTAVSASAVSAWIASRISRSVVCSK